MAYDIVTIGPLLCEIMRAEVDKPLDQPAAFIGPFASGDSAIMINAAAKLGSACAMIGVVGDDPFGRCITEHLSESGVDCSMVRADTNSSTGVAFVSYSSDHSRNFLFHVDDAASGKITAADLDWVNLRDSRWIHVSGFTLSVNKTTADAVYKLLALTPESRVSFDPNLRSETMSAREIVSMCRPVLERASVIFPSKTEAALLTGSQSDDVGCRQWASEGKLVVLKNGEDGCRIYSEDAVYDVPSYHVEEVDSTGAGDNFCGAFMHFLDQGAELIDCARFANAVGAMSVRKLGPMEGTPSAAELRAFIDEMEN